MNRYLLLATLCSVFALALSQDSVKRCVAEASRYVRNNICCPPVETIFDEITNRVNADCVNFAEFGRCQTYKLGEEKRNYEKLASMYEGARNKMNGCYRANDELACINAIYEDLRKYMLQQNFGQNITSVINEYQASCQRRNSNSNYNFNTYEPQSSYGYCNFRKFADNCYYLRAIVPNIEKFITEVARC